MTAIPSACERLSPSGAFRSTALLALLTVLLCGIATPAGGALAPVDAASTDDDPIVERATVERLDDGAIEAELRYEIPDGVSAFEFSIVGAEPTVTETDGFERTGEATFEWTGRGNGGTVVVQYAADEAFHHDATHDRPFDGGDDWAVTVRPTTQSSWQFVGDTPGLEQTFEVSGDGVAGERLALLGPHELFETAVEGERIRLAVPDAAETRDDPEAILSAVEDAAELPIGERSDSVLLIAAPEDGTQWTPTGLAIGPDARIAADVPATGARNVWIHEYVHTRQRVSATADDTRWLIEGSADYYAALASLERGDVDYDAFHDTLARGTDPAVEDAILADEDSWRGTQADYWKGALVAGAIDLQIRTATDGELTFAAVMRAWNRADDGEFDADAFESVIEEIAGTEAREFASQHTRTEATPEPWDEPTHADRFDGYVPPGPPTVVGIDVYPGQPIAGDEVTISVTTEAPDDRRAAGTVPVTVDGAVLAEIEIELAAGESRTDDVSTTFDPGEYVIAAGDRSVSIDVEGDPDAAPSNRTTPTPVHPLEDQAGFGVAVAVGAASIAALRRLHQ